jgi:hypothetical protein
VCFGGDKAHNNNRVFVFKRERYSDSKMETNRFKIITSWLRIKSMSEHREAFAYSRASSEKLVQELVQLKERPFAVVFCRRLMSS